MSGLVFVDTNVLLYAVDQVDLRKHELAREWRRKLWETQRGRLSFQVLQEFYANVTRKWPDHRDSARAEVVDLLAWQPVPIDGEILNAGWKLQDRFGFSFWDALLVAAAMASHSEYLLSEDFQARQDIGGLQIVNPFHTNPSEII